MSVSFLTLAEFKARTVMPSADVDAIETDASGWILQKLTTKTAAIIRNLDKRYGPWTAPYPEAVKDWLERLVTPLAYYRRGVNPSDEQFSAVLKDAELALAEIKDAADSQNGLVDLPLRGDTTDTGISKGGPQGYSEASPYAWTDVQAEAIRNG